MMLLRSVCFVFAVALCFSASQLSAANLVLADRGQSDYQIVVADNASPSTRHAAEELQALLAQMTGVKLPIVSDRTPLGPHEIILGDNAHLRQLGVTVDFKSLGAEGYVIRTLGERLLIAGGPLRGNLYGVYGLLEDHLGCRWFTPSVSRIPKTARLALGTIDERQVPVLEYREPYVCDCFDADWCARNRMNSNIARLEAKHGGKVKYLSLAHTFDWLVPAAKYFQPHPEYFSLIGGRRTCDRAQLCCTNPGVIRLCTEAIRQQMRANPDVTVFSVSQNDYFNQCECAKCQEIARREGSQMGPVLQLVNRVAEAVEKEFPDKYVETLAYQWTRKPPKLMRPRHNVLITLCSIECCFSHPLATCDCQASKDFRDDLQAWAKVAPRLWVWDYTTDFSNYLLPFPNLHVLGPNIQFYAAHNVKGIFEEDTYDTPQGELSELGGYVQAKCLWNPKYDPNRAINEFLAGYYGRAAGPIRQYTDLLRQKVEHDNIHVGINAPANHTHLPDGLLVKANGLWQQAENLVAAQPELLRRVRLSRTSVDYAILERARLESSQRLAINDRFLAMACQRFVPFFQTLQASKIVRLNEGAPLDKEAYRRDLALRLGIRL
jgi:hypothetical protein